MMTPEFLYRIYMNFLYISANLSYCSFYFNEYY